MGAHGMKRSQHLERRSAIARSAGLAEQRHAYYCVLHEDPRFVDDLRILFDSPFPGFSELLSPKQRLDAIRVSDERGETPEDDEKVRAFVQRWSLPPASALEVWWALYVARYGEPLRLRAFHGHITAPLDRSAIRPDVEPFIYNPAHDPQAEAKRVTAELRQQLRQQMEKRRAQAIERGWRPVPPRWRDRAQNKVIVRRLYRRTVLHWRWNEIAAAEGPGTTPHTVEVSVRKWATQLGVPLPSAPHGRPRLKVSSFRPSGRLGLTCRFNLLAHLVQ
jgi:hypothetical protein